MSELFIICMALIFTLFCSICLAFSLYFCDLETKKEFKKKNEKKDN